MRIAQFMGILFHRVVLSVAGLLLELSPLFSTINTKTKLVVFGQNTPSWNFVLRCALCYAYNKVTVFKGKKSQYWYHDKNGNKGLIFVTFGPPITLLLYRAFEAARI